MSNQRYSPEFKDEAVRQIVDRGYSVAEVSERLGVSAHSLHKWVKVWRKEKATAMVFGELGEIPTEESIAEVGNIFE